MYCGGVALSHPLTTTQRTFLGQIIIPNHYCMTSNHVPLILAFKMTFRMTFRMTLRMTFKTWDFRGVFKEDFEGDFEGDLEGDLERDYKGDFRGDFKQKLEGDLLSTSSQVRCSSGSVYSPNLILLSLTLKLDNLFNLRMHFDCRLRCVTKEGGFRSKILT